MTTQAKRGRRPADDIDRHVGARMRERRLMLGLSREDVGKRVEGYRLTYQQMAKYEWGDNRISAGRLYEIARVLGVGPGYFFEGLGESPLAPVRAHGVNRMALGLADSFRRLPSDEHRRALLALSRAMVR